MKHLIIVGARGWGREVYAATIKTEAYRDGEFDIKGFLDSKFDAFEGLKGDFPPIICSPEDYKIQEDDVFIIALGEPKWRKYYAEMMEAKGAEFMSIISDKAIISENAVIGVGSVISDLSIISDNAKIGKHVVIHAMCGVGHDTSIGDYSTIEAYSFLGGFAKVGALSVMHVRSTLIRQKSIGNNVEVGTGSVVMRSVGNDLHVFGNPARPIFSPSNLK